MQNSYVVVHEGEEKGPFEAHEVLAKLEAGELLPVDYIYIEELEDWIMLVEFQSRHEPSFKENSEFVTQSQSKVVIRTQPEEKNEHSGTTEFPEDVKKKPMATEKLFQGKKDEEIRDIEEKMDKNIDTPSPQVEVKKPSHSPSSVQQKSKDCFEMVVEQTGIVELNLQGLPEGVKLESPPRIQVQSSRVNRLQWEAPSEVAAGDDLAVKVHAYDAFNNVAVGFSGAVELKASDAVKAPQEVVFNQGVAEFSVSSQKVAKCQLTLSGEKIPKDQGFEFKVKPGAVKTVRLVAPQTVEAGEPVQVKVVAFDEFGNPTSIDQPITLEAKPQGA